MLCTWTRKRILVHCRSPRCNKEFFYDYYYYSCIYLLCRNAVASFARCGQAFMRFQHFCNHVVCMVSLHSLPISIIDIHYGKGYRDWNASLDFSQSFVQSPPYFYRSGCSYQSKSQWKFGKMKPVIRECKTIHCGLDFNSLKLRRRLPRL